MREREREKEREREREECVTVHPSDKIFLLTHIHTKSVCSKLQKIIAKYFL